MISGTSNILTFFGPVVDLYTSFLSPTNLQKNTRNYGIIFKHIISSFRNSKTFKMYDPTAHQTCKIICFNYGGSKTIFYLLALSKILSDVESWYVWTILFEKIKHKWILLNQNYFEKCRYVRTKLDGRAILVFLDNHIIESFPPKKIGIS